MAVKNEEGSETIVLRVFSDSEGRVYLMYEPTQEKVEVRRPVSTATLDEAKKRLVAQSKEQREADRARLEGTDKEELTAQQQANREIVAALKPVRPAGFFRRVEQVLMLILRFLNTTLIVLASMAAAYKGVEYSHEHLSEALHVIVLFLYAGALAYCIYLIFTEENRRKYIHIIRSLFGPFGLLILPCLVLIVAGAVFGSLTLTFHNHGLVTMQTCAGRPIAEGSLLDFYMWHLLKLVPLLKLNETLKWSEPLCYTQARVGFLILLFQALVVIPSINTIRYYWKNRHALNAPASTYVYDLGWTPDTE
jgi:hypothetical protein